MSENKFRRGHNSKAVTQGTPFQICRSCKQDRPIHQFDIIGGARGSGNRRQICSTCVKRLNTEQTLAGVARKEAKDETYERWESVLKRPIYF